MVASFTISSFDTAAQEISEVYFNYDIAGQGYILSGIFLPSLFTTYLSGKLSTRVEDRIQMFTSVVLIFFLSSLIYQYTHPMNQPLYIFGSASILIFANCYIALLSSKASKMIPAKDLNFTLQVQIFLSLIGRGVGPIVAKTLIVKYGPNAFGLTLTICRPVGTRLENLAKGIPGIPTAPCRPVGTRLENLAKGYPAYPLP
eukprot:Awhi_evm1s4487